MVHSYWIKILKMKCMRILAKALNILPKREHIELVKNLLNWNSRKVIQNKVDHYLKVWLLMLLKRIDLWNVYIDQEIKQDNKTSDEDDTDIKSKVEDLFEKYYLKITRKQAKFFFNKWLNYEEINKMKI